MSMLNQIKRVNNKIMKTIIFLPLPIELEQEIVKIEVSYDWRNDGIGNYNFWGHPGFDKGENHIHIRSVESCDQEPMEVLNYLKTEDCINRIADILEIN